MHAFVPAVLLGMTGLDAPDGNAQAQPPDREPGEIEQSIRRGERNAVVGADRSGQTALLNKRSKAVVGELFLVGFHGFAQQEIARGMVGDGERITVALVAEPE